jgi:nifR3 family TIM-barrel protein
MSATPELGTPWRIGPVEVPNRVLLAPLAGIGNWFVRLQAKRYGAGLAVSEMVSSFAIHHRNEKTMRELLRIHPDERAGGPVSIQLFGHDPEVMRAGAEIAAGAGADLIDINMGCPVPKVRKTGAGAQLLRDPDLALALARNAAAGSGLPVTVKLRSGIEAGDHSGFELAIRLAEEAGVAAIAFHPRVATKGHKGKPDYELTRELVEQVEVPVIVSGGLSSAAAARQAYEASGADAVMIARGDLAVELGFVRLAEMQEEIMWLCEAAHVPCIGTIVPWQSWFLGRGGKIGTTAATSSSFKYTYLYFIGLENELAAQGPGWKLIPTNEKVGGLWPSDADGQAFRGAFRCQARQFGVGGRQRLESQDLWFEERHRWTNSIIQNTALGSAPGLKSRW